MNLLSFNTKDVQGPERAIVYRKTPNMRLGVILLCERFELDSSIGELLQIAVRLECPFACKPVQ
jgi:hypothetical protein